MRPVRITPLKSACSGISHSESVSFLSPKTPSQWTPPITETDQLFLLFVFLIFVFRVSQFLGADF